MKRPTEIRGPLVPPVLRPKLPALTGTVPEGWRRLEGHEIIEPGDMRAWNDARGGTYLERDFFETCNPGYPIASTDDWNRFYIRKK